MARFTGEECGRTNSDVNADKKFIDEGVCSWGEGRACQEIVFDSYWSKRRLLKLFGVYAGVMVYFRLSLYSQVRNKKKAAEEANLLKLLKCVCQRTREEQ